jgi:oxygen-dependent protoporphyrinogen oxidase
MEQIEARVQLLKGLTLAGNAFHGPGIPDCIRSGEQAAERSGTSKGQRAGTSKGQRAKSKD